MSKRSPVLLTVLLTALAVGAVAWANTIAGYVALQLDEAAAQGTPPSGTVVVYTKTDGLLYSKDDAGTETLVSGGAGGGGGWSLDLLASAAVPDAGDAVFPAFTTLATSGTPVLAFDGISDEDILWWVVLPEAYDSGESLTAKLYWAAAGTSQAMEWEFSVGTLSGVDLDGTAVSSILDTANDSGSITSSATQGIYVVHTYTLANGAIDAATEGDRLVIHLNRDASADTSTVDGYVIGLTLSQ